MLNEEKIKLMTKLALYEQKKGSAAFRANKYYRADFVTLHVIASAIAATISFLLLLLIWVIVKVDYLMQNLTNLNIVSMGVKAAVIFVILLIFYMVLSYYLFTKKYVDIKSELISYNENLKELHKINNKEEKAKKEKLMGGYDIDGENFND
ncbi:hypothetical protein [Parasporobacterium paucivorans]|uniref:Uncharacterized protein n=1 Tax=Parasporobacterium paucivorans DSM 15970 TaxID=1122934 RepID=A0A1M6JSE3_9FIRM|nr:hypothetical protein [Parasporobacterium paucivorans]SHJ49611.1 hypothetical protein SAMN02745691_02055 [Parasporobacterium paucivorans DSM 15970]